MKRFTRRDFLKRTTIAGMVIPTVAKSSIAEPPELQGRDVADGAIRLRWLEGAPQQHGGVAWGVPWPRGAHQKNATFRLRSEDGHNVPIQSWITAYWPDGSIKWTGHALSPDNGVREAYILEAGPATAPERAVTVNESSEGIIVDTGTIRCVIPQSGERLIRTIEQNDKATVEGVRLHGMRQDSPDPGSTVESFTGKVRSAKVEQAGPVRAVVKVDGLHTLDSGREWLPFTVRLYFFANSNALRMTHTFVFDGDEQRDFIRGLGLSMDVLLRDEPYNRHVRFVGDGKGLWGEAVQGLTGLRRDTGKAVREAQVAGRAVPPPSEWNEQVSSRLHWIPQWGDFTLSQLTANGFSLKKRTKEGHAWVPADQGKRAAGFGYIGGPSGGLAFGMRDFWQLHPTQLDIRNAHTQKAAATIWMWSPEAPPMDIRFYHDGLGQETYEQQLDALNITYEDYEPGFGTPHGVARSTDLHFWVTEETPTREALVAMADVTRGSPQLVARPADYLKAQVFGGLWSLPKPNATGKEAQIEKRLNWTLDFYRNQVEQRHWYGFWDYGDVMHTYDVDRHVWRYDVGGYAWDNSELSPDLWLWYSFLRTGEAGAFRLAEAMARHTRDVDIYHLGRFAGLGTRHNVQHWGCSAKQLRISSAAYRRFHYYLTTDARTGDVLWEVSEADRQLGNINPVRKIAGQPFKVEEARIGVGTDWGSAATNWLTAWERSGDPKYRNWLESSMRAIGEHPLGFFVGTFAFDVETKELTAPEKVEPNVSHLSAVFGLVEVCAELIQLLDIQQFKDAWLDYCRLYNAPAEQQEEELGRRLRGVSLRVGHSRLTAYAAAQTQNPALGQRAWEEFYTHEWGPPPTLELTHLEGPEVLNQVDEAAWVSTNDAAQWGLAAIQNLALVGQSL